VKAARHRGIEASVEPAVCVRDVSKRFRSGETHDSLRDFLAAALTLGRGRRSRACDAESFWALRDVRFDVARGEAFGIIGPNGAGKSTMLKLLAGILRPEHGTISVRGRLAALIEVGAGFHGDLSGRENIYLNGAILGMTRNEVRRKFDAIVAFAGIERFLDMPVKRYSSGMYARLGFSIAAHVDPDVLLVDEVLSVGDAVFRLRCMERMRELVAEGATLIFVTHNLDQMQSICRRAIVLEGGRTAFDGSSRDAVSHYMRAMSRSYTDRPTDIEAGGGDGVEMLSFRFVNDFGEEAVWVHADEPVRVELTYRLHRPVAKLVVELNMRAAAQENVLSFNSGRDDRAFDGSVGVHAMTLSVPRLPLCGGHYFWNARMWDAGTGETLLDTPMRFPMVVDDQGRATGLLVLEHEWGHRPDVAGTVGTDDRDAVASAATTGANRANLLLR